VGICLWDATMLVSFALLGLLRHNRVYDDVMCSSYNAQLLV